MSDLAASWRLVAVCAIVVLIGLAGICRLVGLSRTPLSLLGILRREHTRRELRPEDFDGRWAWQLHQAATWFMWAAAGLLLLLLVTRILGRLG